MTFIQLAARHSLGDGLLRLATGSRLHHRSKNQGSCRNFRYQSFLLEIFFMDLFGVMVMPARCAHTQFSFQIQVVQFGRRHYKTLSLAFLWALFRQQKRGIKWHGPFFCRTNVPSTRATSKTNWPRSRKSSAKASHIASNMPSPRLRENHRRQVGYGGLFHKSFYCAPVRKNHQMTLSTSLIAYRPALSSQFFGHLRKQKNDLSPLFMGVVYFPYLKDRATRF